MGAHILKNSFTQWTVFVVVASAICLDAAVAVAAPTQAQQDAIRSSCQSDYRTYCSSVPTGGSAALQCLEKNVASLSSSCQQAVRAASGGNSTTTTVPAATAEPAAPATNEPAARLQDLLRGRAHHRRRRGELPPVARSLPLVGVQERTGQSRAEVLATTRCESRWQDHKMATAAFTSAASPSSPVRSGERSCQPAWRRRVRAPANRC